MPVKAAGIRIEPAGSRSPFASRSRGSDDRPASRDRRWLIQGERWRSTTLARFEADGTLACGAGGERETPFLECHARGSEHGPGG